MYPSPVYIDQFFRLTWSVVPDPDEYEFIRAPRLQAETFLQTGRLEGDCDDAATLAASMLRSLNWPCVLIAIRRPNDTDFSHVWCAAVENGVQVDIDPIVPAYRMPIPRESIAEVMQVAV
jgi:transglutaminase-like putative cysteine protease